MEKYSKIPWFQSPKEPVKKIWTESWRNPEMSPWRMTQTSASWLSPCVSFQAFLWHCWIAIAAHFQSARPLMQRSQNWSLGKFTERGNGKSPEIDSRIVENPSVQGQLQEGPMV